MAKLYIDTHVHIYPDCNISQLLNSALLNFKKFSSGSPDNKFVLGLTERFDCNFFKTHQENSKWHGKWELQYDPKSELITAANAEAKIYLLSGRQNISSEKLEVLTLGSDAFRAERLPAVEIIKGSQETGLITILPWSFGKWTGKRGKLVRKLIEDSTLDFSLGDPAHRFGLQPGLFSVGTNYKRTLMCGTDPLPLAGEEGRVAAYGSIFEIEASELSSKSIVKALMSEPQTFGSRINLASAISLQLRMRM